MSRKFQRKIEDFVCENCGTYVKGDGYTNHCPNCLWFKHIDNNPGDRENGCKGMMKPESAYYKNSQWYLVHICQKCGEERLIKIGKKDNKKELDKIIENQILF